MMRRSRGTIAVAAISLKLWWYLAVAPATIRLQVRLQPIESDRVVTVIADGPDYYRSASWTIEGAHAPAIFDPFDFRDVPAGVYEISASVGPSAERIRARTRQTVEVRWP